MTATSRPVTHHEALRRHPRMRGRSLLTDGIVARAYQQFDEWNDGGLRTSILLLDLHHSKAHQARASMFRALIAMRKQDEAGALHELLEAERRFDVCNDQIVGSEIGVTAGYIFLDIGATEDALADLETSWAGLVTIPTTHLQARCAYLLGEACSRLDRWREADLWWQRAGAISKQLSLSTLMARWEINRFTMHIREAALMRSMDDHDGASALAACAIRGLEELSEADAHLVPAYTRSLRVLRLGQALRLDGRGEDARRYLERLICDPTAERQLDVIAEAHRLMARLEIEQHDLPAAYAHCQKGLLAARSDHLRHLRSALLGLAAWASGELGETGQSTAHLRELLQLRTRIDDLDARRVYQAHALYEQIKASAARRRDLLVGGPLPCHRLVRVAAATPASAHGMAT